MPLWGNTEDHKNCELDKFQWPTEEDINMIRDQNVHLKELKMKSALHERNSGICSVRVTLTNGDTSGDINVIGVDSKTQGCLRMPEDHKSVKSAMAYADENGVYNLYFLD